MAWRGAAIFRCAGAVLTAFLLAGCALNDQIDNQVDRLERSIDAARNETILKNIVRASEDQPLSFVTVPTLHGSNSLQSSMGLPGFVFGPDKYRTAAEHLAIFGGGMSGSGAANTITATGTTTFDMTALESKEFYRGLLNPVAPSTIALFAAQDVPREVLFYLFVDSLVITDRNGQHAYRNDPSDPTFPEFQRLLELGVDYGLSFEPVRGRGEARRPRYERRDRDEERDRESGSERDSAEHRNGGEPDEIENVRLCFDPNLAKKPLRNVHPICGTEAAHGPHRGGVYMSKNGPVEVSGRPRSIFSLFQFLGRLVALGDAGTVHLVSDEAKRWSPRSDDVLFRVVRSDVGGIGCFVSARGATGTYCVPSDGAPN